MRRARFRHRDPAGGKRLDAGRLGRGLGFVLAAGVLFQAASGCEAQLSQALQALGQDFAQGVGKGVTSLGEAFLLNLFI